MPDERTDERIEQADGVSNHLKGLLNGGFGLIQGLGLTLRHLFERRKKLNIDEFSIDMSRCMLCNLCVEACPFEAITMSDHYEMADYELEGLVFDKEELVRLYKTTNTAMVLQGHTWTPDEPQDKE